MIVNSIQLTQLLTYSDKFIQQRRNIACFSVVAEKMTQNTMINVLVLAVVIVACSGVARANELNCETFYHSRTCSGTESWSSFTADGTCRSIPNSARQFIAQCVPRGSYSITFFEGSIFCDGDSNLTRSGNSGDCVDASTFSFRCYCLSTPPPTPVPTPIPGTNMYCASYYFNKQCSGEPTKEYDIEADGTCRNLVGADNIAYTATCPSKSYNLTFYHSFSVKDPDCLSPNGIQRIGQSGTCLLNERGSFLCYCKN